VSRVRHPAAVVVALELLALLVGLIVHGPLLDLRIYRMGAEAAYSGADVLYQAVDPATGLYFTYPPFAALLFGPTALLPQSVGAAALTLVSVAALARFAVLISRHLRVDSWWARPLPILAFALATEPVISTFMYGQINIILAALVAEDLLGPRRRYSGIFIGIAASIKLVPGLFIVLLLVGRRYGAAGRAVATAAASVVVGALALPQSSLDYWTGTAFDAERVGGVAYISNQSLNGLLRRLTHGGESRLLWLAVAVVVAGVCLWSALAAVRRDDWLWASAATGLAALLASPISWTHHWVWIIPLVALLIRDGLRRDGWRRAGLLALATGWAVSCLGWLVYLVPHGDNAEYGAGPIAVVVGNSYTWLGVLTVVLLGCRLVADARQRQTGKSPSSGSPDETGSTRSSRPASSLRTLPTRLETGRRSRWRTNAADGGSSSLPTSSGAASGSSQ